MLTFERGTMAQVGGGGDEEDFGPVGARDIDHTGHVEAEVVQNLGFQGVVAFVISRSHGLIEDGGDLTFQLVGFPGVRFVRSPNQAREAAVSARFAEDRAQSTDRLGHFDEAGVGPAFEKFVVSAVDDKKVGLVVGDFFHEGGHAVTGVADAAGIDHLPGAGRGGGGQ